MRQAIKRLLKFFIPAPLFSSEEYWETRYKNGGHSGAGSLNELAAFKAEVLNQAIRDYQIQQVIEFGCGDGNQLALLKIPSYIGLDVSKTALIKCINQFRVDKTKSFFLYNPSSFLDNHQVFLSDAAISIDVIFHLTEISIYEKYLYDLFSVATKVVIIYGPDLEYIPKTEHERYRKFTGFIETNFPEWQLVKMIKNRYPSRDLDDQEGSLSDFYFFTRKY